MFNKPWKAWSNRIEENWKINLDLKALEAHSFEFSFHEIISLVPPFGEAYITAVGRVNLVNHSSFCNSPRYRRETMTGFTEAVHVRTEYSITMPASDDLCHFSVANMYIRLILDCKKSCKKVYIYGRNNAYQNIISCASKIHHNLIKIVHWLKLVVSVEMFETSHILNGANIMLLAYLLERPANCKIIVGVSRSREEKKNTFPESISSTRVWFMYYIAASNNRVLYARRRLGDQDQHFITT